MHRTILSLATLLALCTSLASAQTPSPTRAEVKAETQRARQAGEIPIGEQAAKETPFKATQTRAERKAKTREAAAKGEINSRGEASHIEKEAPVAKGSGKTRAEVKAEARTVNKSHAIRSAEGYPDAPK